MDFLSISYEVKNIAHEAGKYIAQEAEKFKTSSVEYKDINNVVSYVDKTAESLIVDRLTLLLPEAGFITEEETATTSNLDGLNWIIDPLDGTANFIHGLPHYAVSIGLAKGSDILLGVIYHIPDDKMYWAVKGMGAFKEEVKLQVSGLDTFGQSLFAVGFPYYKFDHMHQYISILESLMQKTHGLRRFGSAALDLAYVAEGRFEGFFEYNLNSWDMAAGVLLVKEAGGLVTDFSGKEEYLFRGDVVAGGAVHSELLKEIQRFWV